MPATSGLLAGILQALEAANVEMLAVSQPDASVLAVTGALLRKWNCTRGEITGRALVRFGAGPLSAREVIERAPTGDVRKVEVCYVPPLGPQRLARFSPQDIRENGGAVLVLIGQPASVAEAEQAIRNERRLSLALRSGGYAAWDHDFRSHATTMGPEFHDLLGYEPSDPTLGFERFGEIIHPDDRQESPHERIRASPFTDDTFQARSRVRHARGHYLWIESIAALIRNPSDGRPVRCVGLMRDVTREMEAERRTAEAEKMEAVGRLAAGVAHDFNNLLMAVLGNLQLAERAGNDEARRRDHLAAAARAAEQGSALIGRLLAAPGETPPELESAPSADEHPEPAPGEAPLVLVVEDNPSVQAVAAAMIQGMGYEVAVASSGHEGLKAIAENPDIRLVLSDVVMAGGMSGPEMAEKALALRPELKLLFMSGYAPAPQRQKQQALPGFTGLVNKPFTRADLAEKLRRALAA